MEQPSLRRECMFGSGMGSAQIGVPRITLRQVPPLAADFPVLRCERRQGRVRFWLGLANCGRRRAVNNNMWLFWGGHGRGGRKPGTHVLARVAGHLALTGNSNGF